MSLDLEEQYDKIYRYCYFRLHQRETAEDITQETFLRFFESRGYVNKGKSLQYLYTIAHNLCVNEYRKPKTEPLDEDMSDGLRSESYGMAELELSARFPLKSVVLARLGILGVFNSVLICLLIPFAFKTVQLCYRQGCISSVPTF